MVMAVVDVMRLLWLLLLLLLPLPLPLLLLKPRSPLSCLLRRLLD